MLAPRRGDKKPAGAVKLRQALNNFCEVIICQRKIEVVKVNRAGLIRGSVLINSTLLITKEKLLMMIM